MRHRTHFASLLLACLLVSSCASLKPPTTASPRGSVLFVANEIAIAVNALQHVAIEFNQTKVCPPEPCQPMLSDSNTKLVGSIAQDIRDTIRATPDGARAETAAGLATLRRRLDAAGKTRLAYYLDLVQRVVGKGDR